MKMLSNLRNQRNKTDASKRSKKTVNKVSREVSSMIKSVQERKHMPVLFALISEDINFGKLMLDCSNAVGEPFLHYMLKTSQPPQELVEVILAKMSVEDSLTTEDFLLDEAGRTALHVAAAYGSGSAVIQLLLEGDGRIQASARDKMNRTPLHWACFNPTGLNKSYHGKVTTVKLEDMLDSVAALLEAYPDAIRVRDNSNNNPLDIAKLQNADGKMIELLEAAYDGEPKWLERVHGSTELTVLSCLSDDHFHDSWDQYSVGSDE